MQGFVCACVKPCETSVHGLDFELTFLQIDVVQVCDFEFATRGGFDGLGVFDDLGVVEVQACDGVVRFGLCWFFFDGDGVFMCVEFDDTVAFWVADVVAKYGGTCGLRVGIKEHFV